MLENMLNVGKHYKNDVKNDKNDGNMLTVGNI